MNFLSTISYSCVYLFFFTIRTLLSESMIMLTTDYHTPQVGYHSRLFITGRKFCFQSTFDVRKAGRVYAWSGHVAQEWQRWDSSLDIGMPMSVTL